MSATAGVQIVRDRVFTIFVHELERIGRRDAAKWELRDWSDSGIKSLFPQMLGEESTAPR